MREIQRREFLKITGAGLGAVVLSSFFYDRLLAGVLPAPGEQVFEKRFGVSKEDMEQILHVALSKGGDFADLFFEYRLSNSVVMEDDIIRESGEDITLGLGIRVLSGKQSGYAYTSELTREAMGRAALSAAAIAASGSNLPPVPLRETKLLKETYSMRQPLTGTALADKIGLVKEGYAAAMSHDRRVVKAVVSLGDELQYVTVANSEGLLVSDARPQVRFVARVTAEENGKRNSANDNAGGRVGLAFYQTAGTTPREIGTRAAKEAVILLGAVDPVPGDQPVVLSPFNSGVVIHEAVGHPLEGDSNWKKTSIMWDKLGQMVANPIVTIYDDSTIPFYRGSLNMDDEGTLATKAMLIERGKLVGYLHDRLSARVLGATPNGHGRRDSFTNLPIPRMCNTVLGPGDARPDDILRSVQKGFYAESYAGGQVEDTGKFTFSVNLGYLIEDGKLTRPVKNATLIGTNVQMLKEVEMIADDTNFFLGTCGKDGQSAPVTAGTPTFKIRQMTVGGRS